MNFSGLRQKARAAARAGEWLVAAECYKTLVRQRRATMRDRVQLAHALKEAGEGDAALEAYRTAARHHPTDVAPQRELALYLRRLGRDQEARDVIGRASVLDPDADLIRDEIVALADNEAALDEHVLLGLSGADPVSSQRSVGPFGRMLAAYALGRARKEARARHWREAEHHYRTVIRHDPDHIGALGQLGHALLEQGRIVEALQSYRRALLLNPRNPDIYVHVGHALKGLGRIDSAFAAYLAAWRLKPGFAAAGTELRSLRDGVDDGWLRAAAYDFRSITRVRVEPPPPPEPDWRRDEPAHLERRHRLYYRCLAGSLALKD